MANIVSQEIATIPLDKFPRGNVEVKMDNANKVLRIILTAEVVEQSQSKENSPVAVAFSF